MVQFHPTGTYTLSDLTALAADPLPKVVLMRERRAAQAAEVLGSTPGIAFHTSPRSLARFPALGSTVVCTPNHFLTFSCGIGRQLFVEEADAFPLEYCRWQWHEADPLQVELVLRHLPRRVQPEASAVEEALAALWDALGDPSDHPAPVDAMAEVRVLAVRLRLLADAYTSLGTETQTSKELQARANEWGRLADDAAGSGPPRSLVPSTDGRVLLVAYVRRTSTPLLATTAHDPVGAALHCLSVAGARGRSCARAALFRDPFVLDSHWPALGHVRAAAKTLRPNPHGTIQSAVGRDIPSLAGVQHLVVTGLSRSDDPPATWLAHRDPLVFSRPVEALIRRFDRHLAAMGQIGSVRWVANGKAVALGGFLRPTHRAKDDECA